MNAIQLSKIEKFCKPFYRDTGRWHAWDHANAVRNIALEIVKKEKKEADGNIVQAASLIHDIGRVAKDEGHAAESGRMAKPFLESIGMNKTDVEKVIDAVESHDVEKIDSSKYIEARIVFDADKIEILSVYGFWRVTYWLVEERKMELGKAIRFLDGYCQKFMEKLYTNYAQSIASEEYPLIRDLIKKFMDYEAKWRNPSDG